MSALGPSVSTRNVPVYKGRFAPSPTGPLHFGSLIAAVGSYLEARANHGEWLVRMEDLDPPREVPAAADMILKTLEIYGFDWDGPVLYQSQRSAAYEAALETLRLQDQLYPCACTRKEIADSSHQGSEGPVYPGTCRSGLHKRAARAWRVRTDMTTIGFDDSIQGYQSQLLERDIGDFILKRADGLYAYQLAIVVDDAGQGITHVVRGADLLDSTPRQIHLQRLLGLPTPHYAHLPVAVNDSGKKLSKQTLATPLDLADPAQVLWQALDFLGQSPGAELEHAGLRELWQWARQHWRLDAVPKRRDKMPSP
jgi:glutamyl-Q tRNA(Asp) synthetase